MRLIVYLSIHWVGHDANRVKQISWSMELRGQSLQYILAWRCLQHFSQEVTGPGSILVKIHGWDRIWSCLKPQGRAVSRVCSGGRDQTTDLYPVRRRLMTGDICCPCGEFSLPLLLSQLDGVGFSLFLLWAFGVFHPGLTSPRKAGGILSEETGIWESRSDTVRCSLIA